MEREMIAETKPWPFDFAALKKGDVIPADEVERIVQCRRTDRLYSRKVAGLCERVADGILATQQMHVTVCQKEDTIRILTDMEASAYNTRAFREFTGRRLRAHHRLVVVATEYLSNEVRERHRDEVIAQGRILQAEMEEKRRLKEERRMLGIRPALPADPGKPPEGVPPAPASPT